MDILEEGLKDSIRNIVGNTLSAGISKGARTAAGGMANAGGQLYSTFVKKSTPKGARKQGNPSKPGQYGHKFGGSGGGTDYRSTSRNTPPNAAGSAYARETFGNSTEPHGKTSVNEKEFEKVNKKVYKDVKSGKVHENVYGMIIKPNFSAMGATTRQEQDVLGTVWAVLNKIKHDDSDRNTAEMINYIIGYQGIDYDEKVTRLTYDEAYEKMQEFYMENATRPDGYGFGSATLFDFKLFNKRTLYMDVAEVAKSVLLWILAQPELEDGSLYLLDEMAHYPITYSDSAWDEFIDDAIDNWENHIEEFFISVADVEAWSIMYSYGFCPEGMAQDDEDDDGFGFEEEGYEVAKSDYSYQYGKQGPNGKKKNHFEGMGDWAKAKMNKTKMKMAPAKNMAKDALKEAIHDALVESIGTAIVATGREVVGGIPGAMQAADDRKQEKFMNDPHYQLKVRLAEIKKQKLAEKKLEKQLGKAKKLQDRLRAKGVLPPELDPQLKLRLNRKPTKLLSEEEQHIDSIKNWLPNDYAGYEEYDLSELEPDDIIESDEDEDDYTIPANRVGNGNPFKTDFNEEAITYPEPKGALARILAKSLTTGVGKAGTSLGRDLGEYTGELSTSKDKRHDLKDELKEDIGSLRDRLRKKKLKANGVSEESKTSEMMNSILQKAIKDAVSGAISTGITTAAEIGAENLGTAIGKMEKKNLARNAKDPLYQYKLSKKAALKAQIEAEKERKFLEKQVAKLAKLKAKEGLAEEDIDMYGRADKEGITTADVDPFELQLGVEIEMEHTTDESVAIEIALDHLSEISDYYTRLVKMENHYKREQGIGY